MTGSQAELPPKDDVLRIVNRTNYRLNDDSRTLITGATGFVGRWLLAALLQIASRERIRHEFLIITRDIDRARSLWLGQPQKLCLTYLEPWQISKLDLSGVTTVAHLSSYTGEQDSAVGWRTVEADLALLVNLGHALERGSIAPKFLYSSSGAVYGRGLVTSVSPSEDSNAVWDGSGHSNAYDQVKRASEMVVRALTAAGVVKSSIARLYAFVGPLLPLNSHFAIGNFIRDAASGRDIEVKGSGVDYRSWMHAADMCEVLLRLWSLAAPEPLVVNVGSSEPMTILEAAERVARRARVQVKHSWKSNEPPSPTYYVPNTAKLSTLVDMQSFLGFDDSVANHLTWLTS